MASVIVSISLLRERQTAEPLARAERPIATLTVWRDARHHAGVEIGFDSVDEEPADSFCATSPPFDTTSIGECRCRLQLSETVSVARPRVKENLTLQAQFDRCAFNLIDKGAFIDRLFLVTDAVIGTSAILGLQTFRSAR
jgi:hypothetical protein